jgi:hypothetical protein
MLPSPVRRRIEGLRAQHGYYGMTEALYMELSTMGWTAKDLQEKLLATVDLLEGVEQTLEALHAKGV